MADNIEDLRKEFNSLRKAQDDSGCETNCETPEAEEFADYIIELTTKMLSPSRCGVYFSRKDIRAIAQECGDSISLKQRNRMITDMLKGLFTLEEMEKLFSVIKSVIDERISYYDEFSKAFKSSKEFHDFHKKNAQNFKKVLDRVYKESSEGDINMFN